MLVTQSETVDGEERGPQDKQGVTIDDKKRGKKSELREHNCETLESNMTKDVNLNL